jgi:hypothetical protein
MKVGFFSPLPPAATGVADYSATLLPLLRSCGAVDIAPSECDVALYHVGNNTLHRDIYHRALAHPGVVVLHDAVLQHLLLGMLGPNEYVEEFVYNYGEPSRDLGRQLWEHRARSGADVRYFARPMLKRIATASRAIIVHNPAAAALVREHAPHAQVFEIPHLFQQPALPSLQETMRFRESLGLTPATLLIGTFGHQRETKRLAVILRAFQRSGADARLLVSGEFVSAAFENAIGPLLQHPNIIRTGYLPEPGSLRQPALPVCGGDFRNCNQDDGYRQTRGFHGQRSPRPNPRQRLSAARCGTRRRADAGRLHHVAGGKPRGPARNRPARRRAHRAVPRSAKDSPGILERPDEACPARH